MSGTVSTYTPVTTSGQVTYTGLGNGTDFDSLIKKLVQVEQGRITTLQTWRQSWTTKQAAFSKLSSALTSLKTSLDGMDTIGEFLTKYTTSSDSTVLTASASGDAVNGSHTVQVNRLATSKAMVTQTGYNTATEDINPASTTATFNYTYKGVTYSNAVGANCSLTDLCSIINNGPTNPGVKASVVYDGSKYYMQLRGMDTGASASLVIDDSSTTLTNFSSANFSTITSNGSAQLKVDGWPAGSGNWVTRETNTFSDVVPGVTISLKSDSASKTVTITTDTNTAAMKNQIQTFVSQMNTVRSLIQDLTAYDSTAQSGSILTGNYGLQLIDTNLKSAVASIGVGFDYNADRICSLAQIGIMTDSNEGSKTEGLLVVSNATLDAALASNPDAVAQIFAANYSGRTDTSEFSLSSYVAGTTKCGTYAISYTTDASGKITAATIDGHPAIFNSNSGYITGQHGYGEAGIVIKAIDVTAGTHTGTVSLKEGKNSEISDMLGQILDSQDGTLVILNKNYTEITNMIDQKIVSEQTRIAEYASRLRTRFAKVDSLLSTYNQQQTQLASSIKQLGSSSS